jgi:hypothetical protein
VAELVEDFNTSKSYIAVFPSNVTRYLRARFKNWTDIVYHEYFESCRQEFGAFGPELLSAVVNRVILPEIDRTLTSSLRTIEKAFAGPMFLPETSMACRQSVRAAARSLAQEWRHRVERQFDESDKQRASSEKPAEPESRLRSRVGRKRGRRTAETKLLDKEIRRIRQALAEKSIGSPSTREIAEMLAERKAPIPALWRTRYNVRSWGDVLRNKILLRRASKRISKIQGSPQECR